MIPVGEYRPLDDGVIPLRDLAVAADDDRFFLVRMPTGELVEPRVTHALEAGTHNPPLARFLAEVATAHCAVYQGFDYGTAGRLPYLPRVRYRRTVLAPARWLLTVGDLLGPRSTMNEWDGALDAWRSRWRVPDHVAMSEADRRQPTDLSHPFHRALLRERLRRAGRLELREAAGRPVPVTSADVWPGSRLAASLAAPEPPPADRPWLAQSLSKGTAGIALLHIERALAGDASWARAHAWIIAAVSRPISAAETAGLYLGLPAVAFMLDAASAGGRYQVALANVDGHLSRLAHARAGAATARTRSGQLPGFTEYDVFSGLTGIGALLLRRDPGGSALERVLRCLVRLTRPLRVGGDDLPGWWTWHDPSRNPSPQYPGGHGNFGVAHGIALISCVKSFSQVDAVSSVKSREARCRDSMRV